MSEKVNKSKDCYKSWPFSARVLAEMYGCNEDTVRKIRRKKRSQETPLGQTISVADALLEDGLKRLIQEVKKAVPFKQG